MPTPGKIATVRLSWKASWQQQQQRLRVSSSHVPQVLVDTFSWHRPQASQSPQTKPTYLRHYSLTTLLVMQRFLNPVNLGLIHFQNEARASS